MRDRTVALHVGAWAGVYAAWLAATRAYHPTAAIAAGATAVLVAASAGAVYANHRRSCRAYVARALCAPCGDAGVRFAPYETAVAA